LDMGHTLRGECIARGTGKEGNLKLESVWCVHCRGVNKVILNLQRSLWEDVREVVKRSGRDEPIQVVIHMCMEAMLEISLYSYPYLKLAKMLWISYYFLCFFFNKIGEEGRTSSAWKQGVAGMGGEMAQTMHTHMNKCINSQRKKF
jgi:hypothetical protein